MWDNVVNFCCCTLLHRPVQSRDIGHRGHNVGIGIHPNVRNEKDLRTSGSGFGLQHKCDVRWPDFDLWGEALCVCVCVRARTHH